MIGQRARRYRRPVLIPAPFSENSISLPLEPMRDLKKERNATDGKRKREMEEKFETGTYIIAHNDDPYTAGNG